MRVFGITVEQYDQMFDEQKGLCAICGKSEIIPNKRLNIDHNHKTGAVRKLLCTTCNFFVGRMELDMELTEKVLGYIKEN
jgi:ribosomal protein L37E